MNEVVYRQILSRLGVEPVRSEIPLRVTTLPALRMPLDQFSRAGHPLEIRVPWWPQTLWFVPDEPHASLLEAEGVSRGRIWTAGELMDLLTIRNQPAARLAAIAKLEFGGDVVEVRPRG
jgi:hypothetical protein